MMTKRSLFLFGACALAGALTALRRRTADVRSRAMRETERCEGLLRSLDARSAQFR